MAIFDVIKFDGLKSRDWIIYKYYKDNIIVGSQLIVSEGQVAVFVKGGQVCDLFYPGTFTLETANLPILSGLVNLPFGGKTPFSAEIYYINTTTKLDIMWGTSDPIQLIDPKYSVKLRIRAFGQMGLKLLDYKIFFTELIGGMNQADIVNYDELKNFYKGIIVIKVKSIITDTILNDKISALEIVSKLEEISAEAKERISDDFQKYGPKVVNFYVQSINFPDEDFEKINRILENKAEFDIMGDGRYVTKRGLDVYEGAATNSNGMAGIFAAGGLGLGAAMNMGQTFDTVVSNPLNPDKMVICSQCHQKSVAGSKFCNHCGATLELKKLKCPTCGTEFDSSIKFCSECGTSLKPKICQCGTEIPLGSKFCNECGRKSE